jgi:hypothetical protein
MTWRLSSKRRKKEETMTRKRERDKTVESSVIIPFKKSSFFKYLSYWKELDTSHAIDYMHLEKNFY